MRALLFPALLSAPAFADTLPPVPADRTRLVVVRESDFELGGVEARVSANGTKIGSLSNGKVGVFLVPPGDLEVRIASSLSLWGYNDGAKLSAAAGETHYIDIWPNSMLSFLRRHDPEGPLVGGDGICNGDWCLKSIDAAEAAPLLQKAGLPLPPKEEPQGVTP
ncbi:MAG TPA: hypothetical protein VG889_08635 [Rhizomicrobium sp.]|nr:hypothetical protein [Rhizomicrobium sp.]